MTHFFFFEGLSALREGILAGINGGVHASLATLRAVFEMFALHCYWKQKRLEEDTYDEFYRWFGGTGKAPGFGKLLALCYAHTPPGATTATSAQALYARLCSYVHKPAISESITAIKSGNRPGMSSELARYWAQIVIELQQHVVELLVRASPTALFPIDITRKFGFNPPFGIFFDQDSFRVLQKAIGKELILSYRNAYLKDGEPLSEIRWALDRPNLTDAKIFKSWRDAQTPQLEGKTKAERMNRGRLLLKAKTRVIGQSMAYMLDTPEMPDIRELIATLKSTGQG
jgi:hypothetical protein